MLRFPSSSRDLLVMAPARAGDARCKSELVPHTARAWPFAGHANATEVRATLKHKSNVRKTASPRRSSDKTTYDDAHESRHADVQAAAQAIKPKRAHNRAGPAHPRHTELHSRIAHTADNT